jgi:hypothetical protein
LKRIVKVLAATALMVVLMATTGSPAFATHNPNNEGHFGYGKEKDYQYTGKINHVFGWACGSKNVAGYNDLCQGDNKK